MKSSKNENFIFRASIVVNGKRIYAKDYGKKAFQIPINKK